MGEGHIGSHDHSKQVSLRRDAFNSDSGKDINTTKELEGAPEDEEAKTEFDADADAHYISPTDARWEHAMISPAAAAIADFLVDKSNADTSSSSSSSSPGS